MYLKDLIEFLETRKPDTRVPLGFHRPHSYRGYYEQLAFEPLENTTVGEMLACAREAHGAWYEGYKGGSFQMSDYTDCWLEFWGRGGGAALSRVLLMFMVGETPKGSDVS